MTARIKGAARITAMLRNADADVVAMVGQALFVAADQIVTDAQISITRGSVSGANHVPSRPGEPPNQDTGVLANNIEAVQLGPLRVAATSNAPYSQPLEFGTSKMAARPFMRPAADKNRRGVQKLIAQAVSAAIRKRAGK
jgi:HK97 gp10 family phage protein